MKRTKGTASILFRRGRISVLAFAIILAALLFFSNVNAAEAQTYTVLYSFKALPDGRIPWGLTIDAVGNLYGITVQGGTDDWGTVFKLDTDNNETVLHNFAMADSGLPQGGLSWDANGNLVGTVQAGGPSNCGGTFRLGTDGSYTFRPLSENEGCDPVSTLISDNSGNLYGTAEAGGLYFGGTVFKLDSSDNLTVLHNFARDVNGYNPVGALVRDAAGNLYGVNQKGGGFGCNPPFGCGTAYKLDPTGTLTLLHAFKNVSGWNAAEGLIADPRGNLYGAAAQGSSGNSGVIFKMSTGGKYKILYTFTSPDGGDPFGLVRDRAGNFYGTTQSEGAFGRGTSYKLDRYGSFTVLYNFTGGADGNGPTGNLVRDANGSLFGVTQIGGDFTCSAYDEGCGVVFKISFP